jgi:hypothetical protein
LSYWFQDAVRQASAQRRSICNRPTTAEPTLIKNKTDYLIVGAGASGMAFADTMLDESAANMIIVDRRHAPGGHWVNAYPFVRLHQPSSYYGVNSRRLGNHFKEGPGLNEGLYERASGAELLHYYEQVMSRLVGSGRARFFPLCEYVGVRNGSHLLKSLVSGDEQEVQIGKKLVKTDYFKTQVPSTHPPKYAVADGVTCVPLNDLTRIARPHSGYTVVGAGKTGVDACLWLLENGAQPDSITWIMPRDQWFTNRATVQTADEFFVPTFTAFAQQMEAIASATNEEELFGKLEADGVMLRMDAAVTPTMYHAAVMSEGERTALRRIRRVIRFGRVLRIQAEQIVLEKGTIPNEIDRLVVDCSSSGFSLTARGAIFGQHLIDLFSVRWPAPTLSAALIAHLEVCLASDEEKNHLAPPIPVPDRPIDWLHTTVHNLTVQARWNGNKEVRDWIMRSRLDGYGAMAQSVNPNNVERMALRQRYKAAVASAMANLPTLLKNSCS